MGQYKDMTVPDDLVSVIPHMNDVDSYREELTILGQAWDLLTILGRMSGGRTDMTSTREDFRLLTEKLIASLGQETLSKTILDISAKAQVAVDIIIRNLFERTADIGFLATDDDIRDFLREHNHYQDVLDQLEDEQAHPQLKNYRQSKANLVTRFREYVAKYSVYHNIILLDPDGHVLAQLDEDNPVSRSHDPIIRKAVTTREEFVESFHKTDLVPNEEASLLYAYRVTESNAPGSEVLGVLCLCFRFDNEMTGIFDNLSGHDDWSVISLLDETGHVIASSSPYQIPTGAKMEMVTDEDYRITKFAGRRYIAKTLETKGYQGFFGLGWKGHVMMPLDVAFENDSTHIIERVDHSILQTILNNPQLFSENIQNIPVEAEKIQSELDRTVWNGNISSDNRDESDASNASKVLLWEISRTGMKTKNVFERAIKNLHETVVSTYLHDVEFMASLAIDIMDRNLYERANDCRWWALTSEFRRILGQGHVDENDASKIGQILEYINNLYTVYTNLFVYDRAGRVIAVSNPAESHLIGQPIGEPWVNQTLKIRSSQDYCVSDFQTSSLYADRPTYIYNAAINAPGASQQVVGGIGIVFDSEPEFRAMLMDSLPRDAHGELIAGCFAVFVDEQANVIASTRDNLKPGTTLEIDTALFAQCRDDSHSDIIRWNDRYYAVGIRASQGYREYKSEQDNYKNAVYSLIFMELDKVRDENVGNMHFSSTRVQSTNAHHRALSHDFTEVATFYIGHQWYGVEVDNVIEAIEHENILPIPGTPDAVEGSCFYEGKPITILNPYDLLGHYTDGSDSQVQIVVLESQRGQFGLVVSHLGEIPRISNDRLERETGLLADTGAFIDCVVKPESSDDQQAMLIILNPDELYAALADRQPRTVKKTHVTS